MFFMNNRPIVPFILLITPKIKNLNQCSSAAVQALENVQDKDKYSFNQKSKLPKGPGVADSVKRQARLYCPHPPPCLQRLPKVKAIERGNFNFNI
jgi:hypothetical protein